jgi:hypothetical protein
LGALGMPGAMPHWQTPCPALLLWAECRPTSQKFFSPFLLKNPRNL